MTAAERKVYVERHEIMRERMIIQQEVKQKTYEELQAKRLPIPADLLAECKVRVHNG